MSRAADLLAKFESVTIIDFNFELENVRIKDGKDLPDELKEDMERAERIEIRSNSSELVGYVGRSIAFSAGGYYDEDKEIFVIENYFSKALMSRDGKKFGLNTVNGNRFKV